MGDDLSRYALDANVFIAAYRTYYAPPICPGFWECLRLNLASRRLLVIDRVRDEVTYPPKLQEWLRRATDGVVATTAQTDVIRHYQQMIEWVAGGDQFSSAAS